MIWSCPFAFIGLALAPVAFYFIARKSRRQYELVENSFSKDMLSRLTRPRSKKLVAFKTACLFLSLIAFVFVLAGPKSNELETAEFDTLGRDVFVLFDVSDSMMAEDVAPNRLSVAKLDVEDLLDAALGDRVGLIAFAGSAQVEIPLTTDYVFFRDLLRRIDTTTVRMAGTAIGDAVRLALKRFGADPNRSRAIVLITDGEDHESLPLEAARNAKDANVPIFVVAIGDLKGAKIPEYDASGNRIYKTYDGEPIVSKPDVATLKEIAKLSGGRYYYADASLDLANVYKTGIDQLARSEITQETHRRYKDLYQPFLATGLFFFTLYYFMPTRNNERGKKQSSFFTASLLLALGTAFSPQSAMSEQTVYANEQAAADTKSGGQTPSKEENSAAAIPQTPSSMSKREETRQYNQAMKLFSEGSQEPAVEILESLAQARSKEVAGRSNYNLGAASLTKALEQSKELAAAPAAGANTGNGQQEAQKAENTPPTPEELLEKYNGERKERDAKRRELERTADEAAERFFKSAQSQKNARDANRNANAVVKWLEEKQKEESARELELRAEALPSPELRLSWLQGELQERIERLQKPVKKNSDYYQSLFEERRGLAELPNDAQTVAKGYEERLTDPSTSINAGNGAIPQNVSKASEPLKIDSEGLEKIERAQAKFAEMQRNADSELTRYDAKSSRQSLQNARAQLDVMRDVADTYDGLVLRIAESEKKALDNLDSLKLSDGAVIENYYWERERLRNSVDEVMRKAEDVVKNPPPQPQNDPEEVDLSDVFDEPASNSDVKTEKEEASETTEPDPAEAKSREQRIAESANIALSKRDELAELFEKAKKALEKDSAPIQKVDGSQTEIIADVQRKIEAILEEIARPLQDEQQQNQQNQQQNQNQQNDGQKDREQQDKQQDSQNQDKKNNQDKQSNDPKQDQEDKIPNELDEPPKDDSKEESEEQPKEQEKKPASEKREADKAQTSAQQKEKKELTPEEKEAEALMRQVERRQKDAAEMRAFIRNALKKREKSGKDW